MCGIFGIFSNNINNFHKTISKKSLKLLKKRGPDSQRLVYFKNSILCHSRLSIIDVDKGNQPLQDYNKRYCIIFNGEITNYKTLKILLKKKHGIKFRTNSDTEILLNMYIVFKEKCLTYLQGMFAFAIYDTKNNNIFIARDHIGIKPIYYYKDKNNFYFCSEIAPFYKLGIKKFSLNTKKLDEFIVHGNIVGEETLHKDIKQIVPGTYLNISNNKIVKKKYWYPLKKKTKLHKNFYNSVNSLKKKIRIVFKEWINSDVKISCLTSGGIDSGLLSALTQKSNKNITYFTSYSEDKNQDERNLAKKIIKNQKNHKFIKLSDKSLEKHFLDIIGYTCEPIHNLNSVTFYSLCKYIKNKFGIKVVLTGEGSDENLGGYKRHQIFSEQYQRKKINIKKILISMNYITLNRFKIFKIKDNFNYKLSKERLKIGKLSLSSDPLNRILELDQLTFLPPYLNRMDMIGGMFGMEIRSPFLDKRLIEFLHKIPMKFKIKKSHNFKWRKYILRKIAEKYLPNSIVWNKKKYQFSAPASKSLKDGSLSSLFKKHINKNSEISKIYNINGINQMFTDHNSERESSSDHSNTLIRILSIEILMKQLKNYV